MIIFYIFIGILAGIIIAYFWFTGLLKSECNQTEYFRKLYKQTHDESVAHFHENVKLKSINNKSEESLEKLLDGAAKRLTAHKTFTILKNMPDYHLSGFVVTDHDGKVAIIDKAAVRWLSKAAWWKIMHNVKKNLTKLD